MWTETTDKGLVSKNIKAAHTAQFRKTNSPIKKWAEDSNRHFSKEDIQMYQKTHEKMLTITNNYRNVNKKTMKYHLTPVRMTIIKNIQAINAGEDVEQREPTYTVGGTVN